MIPFITWLFNPFSIALALILVCLRWAYVARAGGGGTGRFARAWVWVTLAWLLVWTQPLLVNPIGAWLEAPYPYVAAEAQPACDAIVLLGGGMGAPRRPGEIPEMFGSADRVWHAARLWRAGKGRFVIASGTAEEASSVALLHDLGVPAHAILVDNQARNTIENGVYVRQMIAAKGLSRRVLLVTSAWHMRRAEMIFKEVGLLPVPAAVDHEASYGGWKSLSAGTLSLWHFLPSPHALAGGAVYLKEVQGLLGDRLRVKRVKKGALDDGA